MEKAGPSQQADGELNPSTPSSVSPSARSGQYYDPVRGSIE